MKRFAIAMAGLLLATIGRAAPVNATPAASEQTIIFAGGCFWGVQSVFEHTKGVTKAVSGYAGGWQDKPNYDQVSSGSTGHAESVKVTYDPAQVSLDQLMKVFFTVAHDPTELNRQGPDVGTQYRSMIIYTSDDQKKAVKSYIDQMTQARAYGGQKIVTEVVPYKAFYSAEEHHQHYAERNPESRYIMMWDAPKVANLKKQFPELYREIR